MPKISVIVPVYNTEKYLRKCLDSIVNQTLQDIEIICVDDCSPDNSKSILCEYENKYPDLVHCIYLEKNIRQGGARNCAMRAAAGDYILFVDSDDYIDRDLCRKLYGSAVSNNADVVIYDFVVENNTERRYVSVLSQHLQGPNNIEKTALADEYAFCYAWNKLWKKELLDRLECTFPEGMVYEDIAVTYVWLFRAETINYVSEGLYHYTVREDSCVHTPSLENCCQLAQAIIMLICSVIEFELDESFKNELTKLVLSLLNDFLATIVENLEIEKQPVCRQLITCMNQNLSGWESVLEQDNLIPPMQKYMLTCFLRANSFQYALLEKAAMRYQNKKVAIWGTGVWGHRITKLLKLHKVGDCLIDNNPRQWGKSQDGLKIVPFRDVQNDCDVIIVAISDAKAYEEIRRDVANANPAIEVVHYKALFTNA